MIWDISNSGVTEDGEYGVYFAASFSKEEFLELVKKLKDGNRVEVSL